MPGKKHMLGFLILCLLSMGVVLPTVVVGQDYFGPWIFSSTSVSGQAVINESVTIKKVTYNTGLPEKQEWKFHDTLPIKSGNTWRSNLFFETRENMTFGKYSRIGTISPISIQF